MKILKYSIMCLLVYIVPVTAWSQQESDTYEVTKKVDTGSHTCTNQGQDKKVYEIAYAGDDRYFLEDTVSFGEVSKFGAGNCVYTDDSGHSVERRRVSLNLENGMSIQADFPVRYYLRAYADCTNDLKKIGSRIGTECHFKGTAIEYK